MENSNIEVVAWNVQEIENYMDIINEIKKRIAIDENGLTKEVKKVIQECKQEIITLRTGIEDLQQENLETFEACRIMALQIHINYKLIEVKDDAKRNKIKALLLSSDEDIKFMDVEKVDNFFEVVLGEKE